MMLRALVCLFFLYVQVAYADYCAPASNKVHIVGVASHIKTGQFLYCEYHVADGDISQIIYTDEKQATIAIKRVDYSMSALAPNVQQNDRRHNEEVLVTRQPPVDSSSMATFLVQYQAANKKKRIETVLVDRPNIVVDAGFDNAIRQYWDPLLAKGRVTLTFVVPAKLRTIQLVVKVVNISRCLSPKGSEARYDKRLHVCYLVKPKSALLSWFVKPITLLYKISSQNLVLFSGSSNVSTNAGSGQMVNIHYAYFDD